MNTSVSELVRKLEEELKTASNDMEAMSYNHEEAIKFLTDQLDKANKKIEMLTKQLNQTK